MRFIFLFIFLTSFCFGKEENSLIESINVVTGEWRETHDDLTIAGPFELKLISSYLPEERNVEEIAKEWQFNLPEILCKDNFRQKLPAFQNRKLDCTYDEQGRLKKITTIKLSDKSRVNWIDFDYSQENVCIAKASTQQTAAYQIEEGLLKSIVLGGQLFCSYDYCQHPTARKKLIRSKKLPEKRFVNFDYYFEKKPDSKDPLRDLQLGKIKTLSAPVGKDDAPVATAHFEYFEDHTVVRDAIGCKTIYRFNPMQEITAVENYDLEDHLYRVQKNFWKDGRLRAKALCDHQDLPQSAIFYSYDDAENLSCETLAGNLSGECHLPILIENGELIQNGIETYSKHYEYFDGLLISEKEDNGKKVIYHYDPKSKLLIGQFLIDKDEIKSRTFLLYDENECLVEEISDDGKTFEKDQLEGISFRRIKRTLAFNSQGFPLKIEEIYLDQDLKEQLFSSELNSFSEEGYLLSQKISNGSSKHFEYSKDGKVLLSNEEGKIKSFKYDALGNQIYEFDSDSEIEIFTAYDFADRVICKETRKLGKIIDKHCHSYDLKGNCISSIDHLGNETRKVFDEFNRQTQLILPKVFNECGEIIEPAAHYRYGISDQVIEEIDAKGYSTKKAYNARNQPIEISYPDGSLERFSYFLDGSLKEEVKRDGTRIVYERDFLGNPAKKTKLSASSEVLSQEEKTFDAFHMIKEGDKDYSYDSFGRLSEIRCGHYKALFSYHGSNSEQKEYWKEDLISSTQVLPEGVFKYDPAGNLCLKQQTAEEAAEAWQEEIAINSIGQSVIEKKLVDGKGTVTTILHDALNRPVKILKQNFLGEIFFEQTLYYDANGNRAALHAGELKTVWNFGPMNRLEETIEFAHESIRRSTRYSYNTFGQLIEVAKPDGVKIFYLYDAAGRNCQLLSSDGTIDYLFTYDSLGNLIQCADRIQNLFLERSYDDNGKLLQENFGNGVFLRNQFDERGRRSSLVLPDGSSIHYSYDDFFLREVKRFKEGVEKYCYKYLQYDLEGKPLVCNLIGNLGSVSYERDQGSLSCIKTPYHCVKRSIEEHFEVFTFEDAYGSFKNRYAFDALQQVVEEKGAFEKNYFYDQFGNQATPWHIYGSLNELLADSESHYSYDLNGNLAQQDSTSYVFDALNRLSKVFYNHELVAEYTYDCFHRRIAKKTANENLRFIYDGPLEIGAINPSGDVVQLRVLGFNEEAEIGSAVAIELDQQIYAPLYDLQGSLASLISLQNGAVAKCVRFSAFGEEKILLDKGPKNPWRYLSKRYDEETNLLFFGRRYYSPKIYRWITPDPAGYVDGVNLYAFVKNNPIANKDLFGLSSFTASLKTFFGSLFKKIGQAFSYLFKKVKKVFSIETYDRLVAKGFLFCLGYYVKEREAGIYGKGEVSDLVRVTMINGMFTNQYWLAISLQALSHSHGGVNIHYVHRPPTHFLLDGIRAFMVRLGFISPHARLLADTWKELIHEMGGVKGGGQIIHYAHSIGTSETFSALHLLSEEERNMIKVYSFGSPTLANKYSQVCHYVSVRDGICLFDLKGFFKAISGNNGSVTFVGSFLGLPLIDHLFGAKSYKDIWEAMGRTFVEWYGSLI